MSVSENAQRILEILQSSKNKEEELSEIILNNDRDTRAAIAIEYMNIRPEGYEKDFKKALSGNFQHFAINVFRSPVEYDVHQLNRALKGFNTDYESIFEIVCSRPNWMLKQIPDLYRKIYEKDIIQLLEKEFGDIGKCITTLFNTERNTNTQPNQEEAAQNAKTLYSCKPKTWVQPEIFDKIFAKLSGEELVLMGRYYYNKKGKNLLKEIEDMPGKLKPFFRTLLFCNTNATEFFAEKLKLATKGLGTDTNLLERILITRSEVDMELIRNFYYAMYKETPENDISDDVSGPYQKVLLGLCQK